MKSQRSDISGKEYPAHEVYRGDQIRKSVLALIQREYPLFTEESFISSSELSKFRKLHLEQLVLDELGDISAMEKEVIDSISQNTILSENIGETIEDQQTYGERIADKIADFGGSWTFIIAFFIFLFAWMSINVVILVSRPFDPYPFILLNLILSSLAAIQAPIIMMSQNRKEDKDRKRSEYDYKVNLKSELEIRIINEKIEHLINHQTQRLLEIQSIQTDFLDEILKRMDGDKD